MMATAGVPILAGSDTATPWAFPGFGLHDEMELPVEAGLILLQALQAATLNPARFLERTEELGTVAEGKLADLVLLDANPLEDISNHAADPPRGRGWASLPPGRPRPDPGECRGHESTTRKP